VQKSLTLLTVILAVLAPACGAGSHEPDPAGAKGYRTQVTRISSQFAQAGQAFRASVGPRTTPRQAAAALNTFQARVLRAAAALDRLTPPPEVARPHRELARTFREIAHATQPSIDAGRTGDAAALQRALRRLHRELTGPLGTRARVAATEIDRRLARS
jgi:hypothetical protein